MSDTCRSCGAAIIWAPSAMTNRLMPLDAIPVDAGTFVLTATGHAAYHPSSTAPRYVSHFATCPNAAAHRKG
jgi:ribulose 1,5-bisphosphate synthetase/thiazole synthase